METKKIKFLGLTIDWNLSWNKHVDDVLSKASSGLQRCVKCQKCII